MTGVLKAKVNGAWETLGFSTSGDEVWIGPDTPTSPATELWYDTDENDNAVDAANYWNSAWGIIGEARWASSWSSASTTSQVITATSGSNTFTAWLSASRRYRLYWQGMVSSTAAGDYVVLQHQVNGSMLGENNAVYIGAANMQQFTWVESRYIPPADGNYTFAMTGRRSSTATGTVSVINTGNNPLWLMIEDLGPITRVGVSPPAGQPVATAAGNALGIIAVGAPATISGPWVLPVATTQLTTTLSVYFAAGRRYRVKYYARAINAVAVGETTLALQIRDGTTQFGINAHVNVPSGATYGHVFGEWQIEGDNTTKSINIAGAPSASVNLYTDSNSLFYVEDVGPNSSPALPIPAQPAPWIPVTTFLNGWTNYGSGWYAAQYRKIGDEVQLRGLIKGGTNATNGFILPPGFRPVSSAYHFAVPSVDTLAVCRVAIDGGVQIGNPSNPGWLDLAGIRFSVTPGPTA